MENEWIEQPTQMHTLIPKYQILIHMYWNIFVVLLLYNKEKKYYDIINILLG